MKTFLFNAITVVLIVLIATVIYYPSFEAPFQLDDYAVVFDNQAVQNVKDVEGIWRHDPSRFLTHLSFGINYHYGGLKGKGYHIVNFIIHLLVSCVVFIFIRTILTQSGFKQKYGDDEFLLASLSAAFIFLVHPIQTSAVTYIAQRSTILTTLFYVSSVVFYILHRTHNVRGYYLLSIISAVFGLFCKPIIITLPLTIILYEVCFLHKSIKLPKGILLKLIPYLIVAVMVPVLLTLWKYKTVDIAQLLSMTKETETISRKAYLLTQFNVIITYIRLLFVPINQNLDYDYPIAQAFFEYPTGASFCMLVLLLALAFKLYARHRLVSFGLFWFFITLSLESSVFPIADVIFEHRLYLPMAGFVLVLTTLIQQLIRYPLVKKGLLGIIIIVFSSLSFQRNVLWSDKVKLLEDVVQKSPNNARALNFLGFIYYTQGRYQPALDHLNRALDNDPQFDSAYNNRGLVHGDMGYYNLALADFNKVLEITPGHALAYSNRCYLYIRRGENALALADCNKSISIKDSYAFSYLNRGVLYARQRQYDLALADFSKAIALDPTQSDALKNRGKIYEIHGQYDLALKDYDTALGLNTKDVNVYFDKGIILGIKGQYHKALISFSKALQIDPSHAEAYYFRGAAHKELGNVQEAINDTLKAKSLGYDVIDSYLENLKSLQ